MFMSVGAWLPYHMARLLFYPFRNEILLYPEKCANGTNCSLYNNFDMYFILIFVLFFIIGLLIFELIFSIF